MLLEQVNADPVLQAQLGPATTAGSTVPVMATPCVIPAVSAAGAAKAAGAVVGAGAVAGAAYVAYQTAGG